jgi:hypothetical protein
MSRKTMPNVSLLRAFRWVISPDEKLHVAIV